MTDKPRDYTDAEARLQFYADTIGVEAPQALLAADGAPSAELLNFCNRYGASLDWIFRGDVRGMIRLAADLARSTRN